jgi:adenylate cyclase
VRYHPSRLTELDEVSSTISRMAGGLAAFRKYLPADLVRILVSEGIEARPGGTQRELTVLFADVAGFTGMSERLGEDVVPLLGSYLDLVSNTVQAEKGTVDKFIGDAVMAFWGAPNDNPDHATAACRAALKARRAIDDAGLTDDRGAPLHVRIGINSGSVLVGNIGSDARLNYTVIGDAVNVASRLESANKRYGSAIIIGERTRALAGDAVIVRKLDTVAVYGRVGDTAIYELIGMDGEPAPAWIAPYEEGLARYARGEFAAAITYFEEADGVRPGGDAPSQMLIGRCRGFITEPPPADWDGTTALRSK